MFGKLFSKKTAKTATSLFTGIVKDAKQGGSDLHTIIKRRKLEKIKEGALYRFAYERIEPTPYEVEVIKMLSTPTPMEQPKKDKYNEVANSLDIHSIMSRNKQENEKATRVTYNRGESHISSHYHLLRPNSLDFVIGEDLSTNQPLVQNFDNPVHWGIFGGTGSGKTSACLSWMACLMYSNKPDNLQFAMLDLKWGDTFDNKEFNSSPYLKYPVARNEEQGAIILEDVLKIMEERVESNSGKSVADKKNDFPALILIIDEVANIMSQKTNKIAERRAVEIIQKIVQMGRTQNVHLLMMGQTAYADTIDGKIKTNVNLVGLYTPYKHVTGVLGFEDYKCHELEGNGHGIVKKTIGIKTEEVQIQSYFFDHKNVEDWNIFKG